MLGYLRRHSDSFLSKALLGFIAALFIFFFGSGALRQARTEMVAEVNGEAIRQPEQDQLARRMRDRYPGQSADQLRDMALDRLIEERLLLQAARDEGFVVSAKELRRAIIEDRYPWVIPSFQDEQGNFDAEAYRRYLDEGGQAAKTERRIESALTKEILKEALLDAVRATVLVTDSEVRRAWEKESSKRNVKFVRVSSALFSATVEPSDEDLSGWTTDHQEAIQERYERDFDARYNQPTKVRARHILLKFADEDDESARAAIRSRMDAILAEVRAEGADFASLSAKYSEDTSAVRGGDLDWFDEKRMVEPFSLAAFALQPGQVSEVVETRYGLHIIKVEERQEAKVVALEDVQVEIARDLYKEEKAPDLARAYAERLVGAFDGSLDDVAIQALLDEQHVEIQETGEFAGGAPSIPKIGRAPEVLNAAFGLAAPGDFTKAPVAIPNGFVVMKLVSATEPDESAWEEDKDQVRERLELTRQTRAIEAYKARIKEEATIRIARGTSSSASM